MKRLMCTCVLTIVTTLCVVDSLVVWMVGGIYYAALSTETGYKLEGPFYGSALAFMILGILGTFGAWAGCFRELYKHRKALLAYTAFIAVFWVTQLAVAIWMGVELRPKIEYSYNEWIMKDAQGFNEEEVGSELAKEFDEFGCCSVGGEVEKFWGIMDWARSSRRRGVNLRNIPVQCCNNYRAEHHEEFFLGNKIVRCLSQNMSKGNLYTRGCYESNHATYTRSKYLFIGPIGVGTFLYFLHFAGVVYKVWTRKEIVPEDV